MIGLVVVAHAGLARELLNAAQMIVGPIPQAEAVGIEAGKAVEAIREEIAGAIEKVGAGGVVIMTDMFGGTPSNMSLSFLEDGRVEVLTGVNLPMLITFAGDRGRFGVAELAAKLKGCGRDSVAVAGDYLK